MPATPYNIGNAINIVMLKAKTLYGIIKNKTIVYLAIVIDIKIKFYNIFCVVVQVFHGAEMDIQWLQRDLCVYVVNMFDTYQAALALSFPRLSLAYLLKHYCNIIADKHYQLYDWRTR